MLRDLRSNCQKVLMNSRSQLMETRSKQLFGQAHRLAVMIAIAHSGDGKVNPTDLTFKLGIAQSAFQAPLRALVEAGLVTKVTEHGRNYYVRQDSKVWDWIKELGEQLAAEEARQQRVRLAAG
jgi:DNA-binding transcriptional ArsR family regulator